MSQQRSTEQNAACSNTSDVITLDDDDEDTDVQFVAVLRPTAPVIDLCLSPSTSAAAAAAAAAAAHSGNGSAEDAAAGSAPGPDAADSDLDSPAATPEEAAKATNGDAAAAVSGEDSPSAAAAALECPICLQTCIHPARLPCGHIFCFLCVKGVAYKNRRCAMCRREIPAEFLDHPQLVNGIEDICTTRATEDGFQWYYEGRNEGWWAYDSRTNGDIEIAYASYQIYKAQNPTIAALFDRDHLTPVNYYYLSEENVVFFDADAQVIIYPSNNRPIDQGAPILPNNEDRDSPSPSHEYSLSSDSEDLNVIRPHPGRLHIQICGRMYVIDFLQKIQYLRSTPEKRRNIMRCKSTDDVPGGKRGVAGLSLN
ncbi:uncharacterized protein Dyak_GE22479, isoform B [Drosophila yakuba]|uniref:E3 ubiquitin-protein ligase n=1 Tax=Drosophila yakuba TaxID=7245 RepID=A0A0R1DZ91_DROYA|nr:uncharacterized protein Dyak_GE22479, isoform B [Drosophila yakuba]